MVFWNMMCSSVDQYQNDAFIFGVEKFDSSRSVYFKFLKMT
jgi:hypothetical protein